MQSKGLQLTGDLCQIVNENNQIIQGYQQLTTDENGNQQLIFVPIGDPEDPNPQMGQLQQQEDLLQ